MQGRQQEILNLIIQEYIKTAEPVGSRFLVENYNLGVSPATVRNEMAELENEGYLFQLHTSAGRAPTDKGYRFFVNKIMVELSEKAPNDKTRNALKKRMAGAKRQDINGLAKTVAKEISLFSRGVGICGFFAGKNFYHHALAENHDCKASDECFLKPNKSRNNYVNESVVVYSSGLSNLFKEPEFAVLSEPAEILEIFDSLDVRFEKIFDRIENDIEIFIGKENIAKDFNEFSLVISQCAASDDNRGMVGVLGPKRMDYVKNINLVDCIKKLVEDF